MRYLDQELESGVEVVRFNPERSRVDFCDGPVVFGVPDAVSLRDHDMAIVGLAMEGDPGPSAEVRVMRGCVYQLRVACDALPRVDDALPPAPDGSVWNRQVRPMPWPTYVWNPVRQVLAFQSINFERPAALRVHWQRLERLR